MAKNGYSRKGFFGETIHYDSNGRKVGETRKNFWGGYDHYDANGKKASESRHGFFGGTNHYDNHGNKVGESTRGFFGGTNHYGCGSSSGGRMAAEDDHDFIQNEVNSFDDPDEAADWLESEGYDPGDFDL